MLKIQSCVYLLIDKFPMNPKLPKEVAWLLCHMLQTWEPTSCKGRLFTHIWNSSEADIVITIIVHIKKWCGRIQTLLAIGWHWATARSNLNSLRLSNFAVNHCDTHIFGT